MSQLWASFYADNVERFRRLLSLSGHSAQAAAVWNGHAGGGSTEDGSIGGSGSKARRASGHHHIGGSSKAGASGSVGKTEINSRDHAGLTLLLRAASSTSDSAVAFVEALLEHPAVDIYVQDGESGWNALHRALYAGNVTIARMLLERERMDMAGQTLGAPVGRVGQLIKTKDHEGNSPFELYNAMIGERETARSIDAKALADSDSDSDAGSAQEDASSGAQGPDGEELFFFGSNKNLTLGLGDGDDRQFPEQVCLRRPDDLLHRFYEEHLEATSATAAAGAARHEVADIPVMVQSRPVVVREVVLSKLHSAVVTGDVVSNLYVCGIGRGGRLGVGDENTRFSFVPVQGPLADKRVVQVALGQNHTMAVTEDGALWTWGSNREAQLGYAVPTPTQLDEEAMSAVPRQVFGPLRKERITGVAASAWHSVAHTGSSLYCWGRNVGQLGLMDADSRSLEVQTSPRKVAASLVSAGILAVSAMDRATTCLLANHTVCVFTSYGYNMVKFPFGETLGATRQLGHFTLGTRHDAGRARISQIASGGETIAAVTERGDLFTMSLASSGGSGEHGGGVSTTNPSKIREALTAATCVWNARKDGVQSVGVGEQGSVIISTQSGAVWRRVRRTKAKDTTDAAGRKKDYKFARVPFLSKVTRVRSSAFGAFAAVRNDGQAIREQIALAAPQLWVDVAPLHVLNGFLASVRDTVRLQHWREDALLTAVGPVALEVLAAVDLEGDLARHLEGRGEGCSVVVQTTTAPSVRLPVHGWILAGRSSVLRTALAAQRTAQQSDPAATTTVADVCSMATETHTNGTTTIVVTFEGLDLLGLLNVVLYAYEDRVVPVWNYARQTAALAARFRQVRVEAMRVAARLQMPALERAVRQQTAPGCTLDADLAAAVADARFFEDADVEVLLADGATARLHSALACRRSGWFAALFCGRSNGQWLAGRRDGQPATARTQLDLRHMDAAGFTIVVRHLYGDGGEALFGDVAAASAEVFLDSVLAVLAMADELLVARLAQVCQRVVARFVHVGNVAALLGRVQESAGAATGRPFGAAALRYVCGQMETMLEKHLLDGLSAGLARQLDELVRATQGEQMPLSRAAEALLQARHPGLAADVDEERQRRIREMAFRSERSERGEAEARRGSKSERDERRGSSQRREKASGKTVERSEEREREKTNSKAIERSEEKETPVKLGRRGPMDTRTLDRDGRPAWGDTMPTSRQDLRAIMTMESGEWTPVSSRLAVSSPATGSPTSPGPGEMALSVKGTPTKLSQKARKKQAEQEKAKEGREGRASKETESPKERVAWQPKPKPTVEPVSPVPLTLRTKALVHTRAASPDTRFAGQPRSTAASSSTSASASPTPIVPHSRVYIRPPPKAPPLPGLGLADIIVQQQYEQESLREAVARRSLQEIQAEQAFQEWWDQESQRAQDEEARRATAAAGPKGRPEGPKGPKGPGAKAGTTEAAGAAGAAGVAGKGVGRGRAASARGRAPGKTPASQAAGGAEVHSPRGQPKARGGSGGNGGGERGGRRSEAARGRRMVTWL